MSRGYNTDGMLTFPESANSTTKLNALESIECAIAFDVRDWGADRRSAWIYAVVFGWTFEDAMDEMCKRFGWDEEDRERAEEYHRQWETLKKVADGLWRKEEQL